VIDVIRAVRLARDRGLAGPLLATSAFAMKHPPVQMRDGAAARRLEAFVTGHGEG
jgi:myo-inositol-1-phosphate synthase